jgi:peptidoglycan/xylan/chitin deacetylase (PgdA/CDA1 family)
VNTVKASFGAESPSTRPGDLLTIVMYHYVRPIAESAYPDIKGLEVDLFREQLQYCSRHYSFVSMPQVVAASESGEPLPPRPLLLTFDDGYIDHYQYVLPILLEFRVPGAFYVTASSVLDREMLDANRIHFVLASVADPGRLTIVVEDAIEEARGEYALLSRIEYRHRFFRATRLDPPGIQYCKHLLQHALPDPLRSNLLDMLFRRYVSDDPADFADNLYLNLQQVKEMRAAGMHIGGHGGTHVWLNRLTPGQQSDDIDRSIRLLELADAGDPFTFCYPHGGYDSDTLAALRARRCRAALTTKEGLASLGKATLLTLPRIDTIDLPMDADAAVCDWTARATI